MFCGASVYKVVGLRLGGVKLSFRFGFRVYELGLLKKYQIEGNELGTAHAVRGSLLCVRIATTVLPERP